MNINTVLIEMKLSVHHGMAVQGYSLVSGVAISAFHLG